MHSLIKFVNKVCVQTTVYWGNPVDNGYGKKTYDAPVEVKVRWDDETKVLHDKNGDEIFSSARIMIVQDVDEQGMIALTTLAALSVAQKADPMSVDGAYQILRVTRTPLFMSTDEFVYEAYLWQTETG